MKKLLYILCAVIIIVLGILFSRCSSDTDELFDEIANYPNYQQFEGYTLFYRGSSIMVVHKDSIIIYDRTPFFWNDYKIRKEGFGIGSHEKIDAIVSEFIKLPITKIGVYHSNIFISFPVSGKCTEHLAYISSRAYLDSTLIYQYLPYRKKWLHYEECID